MPTSAVWRNSVPSPGHSPYWRRCCRVRSNVLGCTMATSTEPPHSHCVPDWFSTHKRTGQWRYWSQYDQHSLPHFAWPFPGNSICVARRPVEDPTCHGACGRCWQRVCRLLCQAGSSTQPTFAKTDFWIWPLDQSHPISLDASATSSWSASIDDPRIWHQCPRIAHTWWTSSSIGQTGASSACQITTSQSQLVQCQCSISVHQTAWSCWQTWFFCAAKWSNWRSMWLGSKRLVHTLDKALLTKYYVSQEETNKANWEWNFGSTWHSHMHIKDVLQFSSRKWTLLSWKPHREFSWFYMTIWAIVFGSSLRMDHKADVLKKNEKNGGCISPRCFFNMFQSDKIFILIDANAATGPRDDVHVFQHDDRTSVNTKYFMDFLRETELAVPSTSARHEGSHHTWTSPIDEEKYRLDYVLLRADMVGDCVHSQTVPEFDLGNYGDHIAVAIQVQWNAACTQLSRPHRQAARGPGVQRSSITHQKMHAALTEYQPLPWSQDIETQVNHMNHFVHNRLRKHCSRQEAAPKKHCLSGEVWTLRSRRIQTKKKLVEVQQRLRAELLFKALLSWHNHAETLDADTSSYMTTLICGKLRIVAQLHRLDRTLRHALQQAKGRALDEQLRQMPHDAAASTVLHEIKQIIGTTNFKKKKSTPLPLINRADGTPCRSIQEVQDRWIHFFQFMECGERLDEHALRQKWIGNLYTFRRSDVHLRLQDLPSLTDLEQAFRNVKANKATGDDGIPSEICHACPAAMGRITYTQLMKLCAHGQEALLHKGGKLVTAFKHKGSSRDPSSYRSLMISSRIAKTLHRSLRSHQADYYERFMQQQQIGGRRKVSGPIGHTHGASTSPHPSCTGQISSRPVLGFTGSIL